jgi:hypothetical protein
MGALTANRLPYLLRGRWPERRLAGVEGRMGGGPWDPGRSILAAPHPQPPTPPQEGEGSTSSLFYAGVASLGNGRDERCLWEDKGRPSR